MHGPSTNMFLVQPDFQGTHQFLGLITGFSVLYHLANCRLVLSISLTFACKICAAERT